MLYNQLTPKFLSGDRNSSVLHKSKKRRKMDFKSFNENHPDFVESQLKIHLGDDGFVLEYVPILMNFLPDLPVSLSVLFSTLF